MIEQHATIDLHSKWTLCLNEAASELSRLSLDPAFRNNVVREYIWGGMSRTLRYMLPPPAWNMESEHLNHDEEVELWRENLVFRKQAAMQQYIRAIRSSTRLLSSRA
ncbi:MAG: hypothetical protein GTO63_15490 [Anaerolineae bacterium]|nr:hypothetical protein [Anaerolineae bacterium]NIN96230.1 hypothetical protein [Anaerolineae bacterium]NIQ79251.1 hypothetical protein [Anaerolineae bacterium]